MFAFKKIRLVGYVLDYILNHEINHPARSYAKSYNYRFCDYVIIEELWKIKCIWTLLVTLFKSASRVACNTSTSKILKNRINLVGHAFCVAEVLKGETDKYALIMWSKNQISWER